MISGRNGDSRLGGGGWVVLPKGTEKLVVPSEALTPSLAGGGDASNLIGKQFKAFLKY